MSNFIVFITIIGLSAIGYRMGRSRALALAGGKARQLNSLPVYYGGIALLWCGLPAFIVATTWLFFEPLVVRWLVITSLPEQFQVLPPARLTLMFDQVVGLAAGEQSVGEPGPNLIQAAKYYRFLQNFSLAFLLAVSLIIAGGGLWVGLKKITINLAARDAVEASVKWLLIASSILAILVTIGIVLSLLFETILFFDQVPIHEFLFGLKWSPQTALRADQIGSSGTFGAVPIFAGTLLISGIAMVVAVPVGLMSAIFLAEYASKSVRGFLKPALEILAGIPTVVYGFFAALTVAPLVREFGDNIGLNVASESALAAGVVMGIMIIPFVSSLSDDVITAVPLNLREGSYGLGAMKSETIIRVVLPAALPGIVGSILLAVSRAIGETMIVVMAAGLAANLTANPFAAVTTVTVQIVTLLVGDQEFDSAKTLAAFALGLVLFFLTLGLNVLALATVRKYREQYD